MANQEPPLLLNPLIQLGLGVTHSMEGMAALPRFLPHLEKQLVLLMNPAHLNCLRELGVNSGSGR